MFAIVNTRSGPPEVLEYKEIPDPVPGADEIMIAVQAISIEGGDLISRRMTSPEPQPHVIGYQAAGIVLAVGADVQEFTPGGRVVTTGFASGKPASADLMTIMLRRLMVTGSMFGLYMTTDANRAMIQDYLKRVAEGEFTMPIHARFPLADAIAAHVCAENDRPLGRVIIQP